MDVRNIAGAVVGLPDFLADYPLLLHEFRIGQGGIEQHVALNLQPFLEIVPVHQDDVIGEVITGVSIVVSAEHVHFFVECFLGAMCCPVEQQVFQHMVKLTYTTEELVKNSTNLQQ